MSCFKEISPSIHLIKPFDVSTQLELIQNVDQQIQKGKDLIAKTNVILNKSIQAIKDGDQIQVKLNRLESEAIKIETNLEKSQREFIDTICDFLEGALNKVLLIAAFFFGVCLCPAYPLLGVATVVGASAAVFSKQLFALIKTT